MKRVTIPQNLSKEAKKIFKGLVAEYQISDIAGLKILRVALEAFDRAQAAREVIEKEGMQIRDRFGVNKCHPLLTVERDARSQFLLGLKALNLDLEPLRDGPGRPPGR